MDKMLVVSNTLDIQDLFGCSHDRRPELSLCSGDLSASSIQLDFVASAAMLAEEMGAAKKGKPYAILFVDMDHCEDAIHDQFLMWCEEDQDLQIIFCTDRDCNLELDTIENGKCDRWLFTKRSFGRSLLLQTVCFAYLKRKYHQECVRAREETKRLENVSQTKIDFLANVSHELRTPVHAIGNFLQFGIHAFGIPEEEVANITDAEIEEYFNAWITGLREELDTCSALHSRLHKVPRWLIKCHRNNAHHLLLLDELLEITRAEYGEINLQVRTEDLRILTDEVVGSLEASIDNKEMILRYDIIGVDFKSRMDKEKITQVIRNLIGNAIKFSPQNTEIILRLTENPLLLSVSDSGPGIDQNDLVRIFDRYYRSPRTKGTIGTGLGLAISYSHIMQHGGKLWAESNGKNGSTFFLMLPKDN